MKNQNVPSYPPWNSPETVARFSASPPNAELMAFAANELCCGGDSSRLLDIGCGAGSNAIPLARIGWNVLGLDLSGPMLEAAVRRAQEEKLTTHLHFKHAPMDQLPVADQSYDFIVAHGIWNLARSAAEFREALREAARAARPNAALFVFTFSRNTLSPEIKPVSGEPFIFTEFSGAPQCFLTEEQLIKELAAAGFTQELGIPIKEYPRDGNRPTIYEGIFRRNN